MISFIKDWSLVNWPLTFSLIEQQFVDKQQVFFKSYFSQLKHFIRSTWLNPEMFLQVHVTNLYAREQKKNALNMHLLTLDGNLMDHL